jgi:hypothetical protein
MLGQPKHARRWFTAAAVLALAAVSGGCGHNPVQPKAEEGAYTNPVFVSVPTLSGAKSGTQSVLSSTTDIDGAVGGVLTVGRFTVSVPGGAFAGTAQITITVPDPSLVTCTLDISPASANGFLVPVTLTADCSGAANVDLQDCGTLWYDTGSNVWRTVGGSSVDTLNHTVTASLPHFSTYGVADLLEGRAGW